MPSGGRGCRQGGSGAGPPAAARIKAWRAGSAGARAPARGGPGFTLVPCAATGFAGASARLWPALRPYRGRAHEQSCGKACRAAADGRAARNPAGARSAVRAGGQRFRTRAARPPGRPAAQPHPPVRPCRGMAHGIPGLPAKRRPGRIDCMCNVFKRPLYTHAVPRLRKTCPACKSRNVAAIVYGYVQITDELEQDLNAGRAVLGGCSIPPDPPAQTCGDCGHAWGIARIM